MHLADYNGADGIRPRPPLLAALIVENKRDSLAYINARRSYINDAEIGAVNLLFADRILPPRGRCRIRDVSGGMTEFDTLFDDGLFSAQAPAVGRSQQVFLDVSWEDGTTEQVRLGYEVMDKAASSAPQHPAASSGT